MKLPDKITLTVTDKHIRSGERDDCVLCPIALAFTHAYPDVQFGVYPTSIYVMEDGEAMHYELPREAIKFIDKFDNGIEVQPLTFTEKVVHDLS